MTQATEQATSFRGGALSGALHRVDVARGRFAGSTAYRLIDRNPVVGLGIVLFTLPFIMPQVTLGTQILIFGLAATSLNLLFGFGGVLSFGHSTYYGLGVYAAGLGMIHIVDSLWLAIAMSVLVTAPVAAILGWFCLRRRGVYFAMLTLAFNQLVYYTMFHPLGDLTGGDDGLRGIPLAESGIPGVFSYTLSQLREPTVFYFVVFAFVLAFLFVMSRIVESPLGKGLQAIRESEDRARAVGFDTNRMQLTVFVFAGVFAGLAGSFGAMTFTFAGLENLNWFLSGVILIMAILGGRGTFVGPFVGAGVYLTLEEYLSQATASWLLILGAIFVVFVLILPLGVWGTTKALITGRSYTRPKGEVSPDAPEGTVTA
ncbi:MAG: branched-chain amino acid ABC transporter permease [Dehalococcoidia bacterium]|nr:branched-chain amino acid ABC transporter permease [Dehalococcoidia bacterium]